MNRRNLFRIKLPYPEALITGIVDGKARRYGIRIVDLSGSGASVLASTPLHMDDPVRLHLPAWQETGPLDLPARVVHVKSMHTFWEAGLRFTDLSPIARDLLIRHVRAEEQKRLVSSSPRISDYAS